MKTTLLAAVMSAAVLMGGIGSAAAQQYPERPIRYVLHVSPGGATDVMARKLSTGLERVLGQPVVVENKPAGRGASQMAEITGAKPDGHTIGAVTATHIGGFNQTLKQYNIGSVDWIAKLVQEPYLYVVHKDSPIKSLNDLANAIKSKGSGFVVAGFVRGSGSHLAWEMFEEAAKIPPKSINWVPYDSVGDAVTAVLGKHGEVTIAYLDLVKDHVEAGNLRVIGIMADNRLDQLPDVPTFKEQGLEVDTSWQQFRGIIGPKGIPADVKDKLVKAVEQVMTSDEMKRYIKESSLVYDFMGPAKFTEYAEQQDRITKDWMKRLGLTK
ncbi:MAG: tripartite tricarboxylate transporter substrate binding protein [Pseudomonadota bacterium]|nr:tripartite tricarboxylate transporter substrate binding protein [Pseudomonadota bacterium]